jgi:hypothetical protein
MTLQEWIKTHKPYKNGVVRVGDQFRVYAFKSMGAQYNQLFRLSDYDAIQGSESHIVWLTPKIAVEKTKA